jgi:hypothetical protein
VSGVIERRENGGDRIVDVSVIDRRVRTARDVQLPTRQRCLDQVLRDAIARQARAVDPRGAQVDHFESVQVAVGASELLDRRLADAVGQDRVERMLLAHEVGAKGAICLLRADMDAALDCATPHRLEDVQRTLDVDAHDLQRVVDRGQHADDRRAVDDRVGRVLPYHAYQGLRVGNVADHLERARAGGGMRPGSGLGVERDRRIPACQQRTHGRGAEEAAAAGHQYPHRGIALKG